MDDETDKAIDDSISALMSMRLDGKKEQMILLPTRQGLERRYKMTLDDKGNARMDEVKYRNGHDPERLRDKS